MSQLSKICRGSARLVSTVLLVCVSSASATIEYSVTDLGTLGGDYSGPTGINSLGQVAGVSTTGSGAQHAFLYANGHLSDLGTLQAPYSDISLAGGINDKGQVVGASENATTGATQGFLYSNGSMMDISGGTGAFPVPEAINNSGLIGGSIPLQGFGSDSFLYFNGTRTDIGDFGYQSSTVAAINNNGTAAIFNNNGPSTDIMLYKNGATTDLGDFSNYRITDMLVSGINDSQQLSLTGSFNGTHHAYLYSAGTLTDLGGLGGTPIGTQAQGLNNFGQVVGQSQTINEGDHAFLYSNGAMNDLNDLINPSSGWVLTDAVA
jgi:probable HAF family extracellular repeat protein